MKGVSGQKYFNFINPILNLASAFKLLISRFQVWRFHFSKFQLQFRDFNGGIRNFKLWLGDFNFTISGSKFYLHLWRPEVSHHSKIQLLNHVVWQPTLRAKEGRYTTNEFPFQQETPWVKQRRLTAMLTTSKQWHCCRQHFRLLSFAPNVVELWSHASTCSFQMFCI